MTEQKDIIDIEAMREQAAKNNQEKTQQFYAGLNKVKEHSEREQAEINALYAKAVQSDQEDAEKRRAIEIEAEKAKATKAIEDRYERRGVKSDHTKRINSAIKNMLKDL